MRWDLFCRVIDNHGDLGVCWRLAADLAQRGEAVRLWIDDPAALAWMAPQGAPGVQWQAWRDDTVFPPPGDVVVEAFGCDPPPAFVAAMRAAAAPPLWINLEYLSAEDYVERSHGLRSPQFGGPGAGLDKWFFYPGFTPRTGGLLREPGLLERRAAFDRDAWLAARGWARRADERVVVLFCYPGAPLAALAAALGDAPTLLLAAPGGAQQVVGATALPRAWRGIALPWLTQPQFDELLWCGDLNLVRGEDSFVRAQWAGAPFVWQIYPQQDGAHGPKLEAFLERVAATVQIDGAAADVLARCVTSGVAPLWRAWNGLGPWPARLPAADLWQAASRRWRDRLLEQDDLVTQLLRFVTEKR